MNIGKCWYTDIGFQYQYFRCLIFYTKYFFDFLRFKGRTNTGYIRWSENECKNEVWENGNDDNVKLRSQHINEVKRFKYSKRVV